MQATTSKQQLQQAQRVADAVAGLPGLVGVTLGGSAASGLADAASDLDLHVYWRAPLAPTDERTERLRRVADQGSIEMDVRYWGHEDHLKVDERLVELIYVNLDELRGEIEQAYGAGLNGEGFVTTQFFYLANGHILHDATGEVAALQQRLQAAYPEPTRRLLLTHNPVLLRAYLEQFRKAQRRGDLLYVQHRRYTIQMVFFNLLFALNRRYHPGEKRLLKHTSSFALQPPRMAERWERVARLAADAPALADELASLVRALCALVEEQR